jgi:hypothetical protein
MSGMFDKCCDCQQPCSLLTLGTCPTTNCPSGATYPWYEYIGSVTPDVLTGLPSSFGTSLPTGTYIIEYCSGSYQYGANHYVNNFEWRVNFLDDTSGGAATYKNVLNGECTAPAVSGAIAESTCLAGSSHFNYINHRVGEISVQLHGALGLSVSGGVTFNLYRVRPVFVKSGNADFVNDSAVADCHWTTPGTSAVATFAIGFLVNAELGSVSAGAVTYANVTASLDSTGGITGSTPVLFNMYYGSLVTINFTCATSFVTATLRLAFNDGTPDKTFDIYLGPLYICELVVDDWATHADVCDLTYPYTYLVSRAKVYVTNLGYWINDSSLSIDFGSGASRVQNLSCVPYSNPHIIQSSFKLVVGGGQYSYPSYVIGQSAYYPTSSPGYFPIQPSIQHAYGTGVVLYVVPALITVSDSIETLFSITQTITLSK